MKWTSEQQKVIDLRDRNILVSAAAGSGKTAVLVERIIKRITEDEQPIDIDQLLVVTFTNAAAAEMRERIGDAIDKRLEEDPENENLRRQQTLLHNAQITTIDSFCLFVVRNHFEDIDMDPNFRIADQGELKLLEQDVLNEVFEEAYAVGSESFLRLTDTYSDKRSNKAVKEMVGKIYHQSASNPWPKEWIRSLLAPYEVKDEEELLQTNLMQGICRYAKALLLDMPSRLENLRSLALESDGPQKYAITLDKDLALFEGVEKLETFEEISSFCKRLQAGMGSLAAIRGFEGDPQKKEAVSSGRAAIKDDIKTLNARYFSISPAELTEQLKRIYPIAEELIRISLLYLEAMEERKRQRHIVDFADIEHAALRIFVDENTKELRPAAYEFQQNIAEIMIDEYQDSNQVQEEILCAISSESQGGHNMFMVGDVKQSIYRFRMARPELFMEKFRTYDLSDSRKQRIDLHKNFRSRSQVLDFTNDIFYKIMNTDLGNVLYDQEAALYCGADYPENGDMKAQVLLYEIEEEQDDYSNRQLEARMVAEQIQRMKEDMQITDKKTGMLRPVRNSDIVILLRSLQGWASEFVTTLENFGIPAHMTSSTGYFSAVEVQTVLSFLKILDNPYQDIPMAAVLHSPIVGLDDEELAELSLSAETSFAEGVCKSMQEASEGKLAHFTRLYSSLREKAADTPIHQLIGFVLEETGYGDYVKALPGGSQRKANLDMLVEKAIDYEKTSYKGLFHFVRYIDQLQKYEVDFGEADVLGENEDVVRIMTIHKSKGLEFPIVFVSGISKEFNNSDIRDKAVIHPDLGLGLDELTLEPRTRKKCLVRSEIAEQIRRDNLGEELRVLYVAMTRAKEKLILTGTVKNRQKLYESHTGMCTEGKSLPYSQRITAKGYIDWIVSAVLSYPDKYELCFVTAEDLILQEVQKAAVRELSKADMMSQIKAADPKLAEEMKERLSYVYPYTENRKSKYSVSELKHLSMVEKYDRTEGEAQIPDFLLEEREPYIPDFAMEPKQAETVIENRGALRGSAFHRVMECMRFERLLTVDTGSSEVLKSWILEEMEYMKERHLITEEMLQLVLIDKIAVFLQSPVAMQMAQAQNRGDLFREKAFVMDHQGVLVQGIIDVFWLEGDKIVLLDYKTDRVQKEEELIKRYEVQLELYADALMRIFSTGTKQIRKAEKKIYSFALGRIVSIDERQEG